MTRESLVDRLSRTACLGGLLVLSFVGGSVVVLGDIFPARYLKEAHQGAVAYVAKQRDLGKGDEFVGGLWEPARTEQKGVVTHDPSRAFAGYTLYTSGDDQAARLIDMEGRLIHEWRLPFSQVWDETSPVREPLSDHRLFFRTVRMYPNGDLLAIYEALGDTPYGYGLVKLDKNSNVLWKYLEHAHHDLDIAPDGRVVTLTQEVRRNKVGRPNLLDRPRLDDFVVVLSPDGQELQRVPLLESLLNSPYARLLDLVPWYILEAGDMLHANAVEYLDEAKAKALGFAKPGQVLVSLREIGTLAIVDLEQQEVVWALRGAWIGQHDPDVLPNGNILLFDNNGHFGEEGSSRVIEIDPGTGNIVWSYAGTPLQRLESVIRSSQERLPNGNVLLEESNGGRLIEVDRAGTIVWEYVNGVRGGEDDELVPVVSLGQRMNGEWFDPGLLEEFMLASGYAVRSTDANRGRSPRG